MCSLCSLTYKMSLIMNFNCLLLCVFFSQGIIGILSEKDSGESSDILPRQKRVISHSPGEDLRQGIRNVPYIVLIKVFRQTQHCPGTMLTSYIVITAAKCVQLPNNSYRVYSGTSRLVLNGSYKTHKIIDKRSFHGLHPYRPDDGISLVAVDPPFTFNSYIKSISLLAGHLPPGTHGTVTGWGCHEHEPFGTQHPDHLRSINVPIISIEECRNIYLRLFAITEADICTLDLSGQRYCAVNDAGAPLVVNVNQVPYLVGIHLWNGGVSGRLNPDVFINLQDHRYNPWIIESIASMEANIHHHNTHIHK